MEQRKSLTKLVFILTPTKANIYKEFNVPGTCQHFASVNSITLAAVLCSRYYSYLSCVINDETASGRSSPLPTDVELTSSRGLTQAV